MVVRQKWYCLYNLLLTYVRYNGSHLLKIHLGPLRKKKLFLGTIKLEEGGVGLGLNGLAF